MCVPKTVSLLNGSLEDDLPRGGQNRTEINPIIGMSDLHHIVFAEQCILH